MKTIKEIIEQSGINFGTSGARGLVTDFTSEVCTAFTLSFLDAMQKKFTFKKVAVAMDNRPSSPEMAAIICGAIESYGFEVDFYGVLPTPALALQAMSEKNPSIMITGSHIPFDRNGIKFYRPDGEISKEDEIDILNNSKCIIYKCIQKVVNFDLNFCEVVACNEKNIKNITQLYYDSYKKIGF